LKRKKIHERMIDVREKEMDAGEAPGRETKVDEAILTEKEVEEVAR
jgi:hypothetical protein